MADDSPSPSPEALANDSSPAPASGTVPADPVAPSNADSADADANIDHAAIEEILRQASLDEGTEGSAAGSQQAGAESGASPASRGSTAEASEADDIELPNFQQVIQDAQVSSIDLLRDVDLNVRIELGRSRMMVEDVLKLGEGSVVELDKLAGDPVDVFVNERLVARGEVLVLNDNFCVRINEIVAGMKEEPL